MGGMVSRSVATPSNVEPSQAPAFHRSVRSNTPAIIEFVNTAGYTVHILWCDYTCKWRLYKTLEAGAIHRQKTYLTHPWAIQVAKDSVQNALRPDGSIPQLICQETGQAVIYATAGSATTSLRVFIKPVEKVEWSPDTHQLHFGSFHQTVNTVLLCHTQLRNTTIAASVKQSQEAAPLTFGALPKELVFSILAHAAPAVYPTPPNPPLPDGATEEDYTKTEIGYIFAGPK